jgi:DNA-binding XRE family transcriptional regulator
MSSLQNQESVAVETAATANFQAGISAQQAAKNNGRVFLVTAILKDLRTERLQSQEDMANACSDGKFRVSIASIKRAETGRPVVFRVARELARYFGVPVQRIIKADTSGLQQMAATLTQEQMSGSSSSAAH